MNRYGSRMTLQAVLRRAITDTPGSLRALAREAGLPHVRLVRIRQGTAITLTLADARRIAAALERWSGRSARQASLIRAAVRRETQRGRDHE